LDARPTSRPTANSSKCSSTPPTTTSTWTCFQVRGSIILTEPVCVYFLGGAWWLHHLRGHQRPRRLRLGRAVRLEGHGDQGLPRLLQSGPIHMGQDPSSRRPERPSDRGGRRDSAGGSTEKPSRLPETATWYVDSVSKARFDHIKCPVAQVD